MSTKADVFARLQREVLSLEGYKATAADADGIAGWGRINRSFPNGVFPRSAVHEFVCAQPEEAAAASAFVAGILSSLMHKGGATLWIGTNNRIFPPALKRFGVEPHRVFFLRLKNEKDVLWAVGEALRCRSLAGVVGELRDLSFTDSRRLQLAVESSGVSCFLLRHKPKNATTAAVTRWRIKPLQSRVNDALPGIGFPRWQVDLLKVRNGKPGSWDLQWVGGRFRHATKSGFVAQVLQKKTG